MYDQSHTFERVRHEVGLETLRMVSEDLVDVRLSVEGGECTYVDRRFSFGPRATAYTRFPGRKAGGHRMVRHMVATGVPMQGAVLSAAETRHILRGELRRGLSENIRRHHHWLLKELERRKAFVPLWRRMWLRACFARASFGVAEVLRRQLDYITTPRRDGEGVDGSHFRMAFQHYDAATRVLDKQVAHLRRDLLASLCEAERGQEDKAEDKKADNDAHRGGDVTYVSVRRGHMPVLFRSGKSGAGVS